MASASRSAFGRRAAGSASGASSVSASASKIFFTRLKRDYEDMTKEGVHFVNYEDSDTLKSGGASFYSWIIGPKDTPYEGYCFQIRVYLPPDWPVRSPSIAFVTKVMHVNIEINSGSICCNQLNEDYAPATRLSTIIKIVLPQLLEHPNGSDPFNVDAARLLASNADGYAQTVRSYVLAHGIPIDGLTDSIAKTAAECSA